MNFPNKFIIYLSTNVEKQMYSVGKNSQILRLNFTRLFFTRTKMTKLLLWYHTNKGLSMIKMKSI